MKNGRWLYAGAVVVALVVGLGFWNPIQVKAGHDGTPKFKVDPFWPKPLPVTITPDGVAHHWGTGEIAASCVDSQDNVFTYNRGWEVGVTVNGVLQGNMSGAIVTQDGYPPAIPSPPVVAYNREGKVVYAWGNPTLLQTTNSSLNQYAGGAAVMPQGAHGCFVDYQDNVWLGGNGDGIVQKYTRDGTLLAQIGTKGLCDGTVGTAAVNPTCGEGVALNTSHTLLNDPPDMSVDPLPDPVTGNPGSIYIADGYGNHRVVVFGTTDGIHYTYLRQWGSKCTTTPCGPSEFGATGGGHPHCVVLGNDGYVYACDRPNSRILVFTKTGTPVRQISVDPTTSAASATNKAAILLGGMRACDINFYPTVEYLASKSPWHQKYILDTDLGSDNTWLIDKATGTMLKGFGRCGLAPCPGHNAGEFAYAHTVTADSHGDVYVAETITGRRLQKFVRVEEERDRDDH